MVVPVTLIVCAFAFNNVVFITWTVTHLSVPKIHRKTLRVAGAGKTLLVIAATVSCCSLVLNIGWVFLRSHKFTAEGKEGKQNSIQI